MNAITLLRHSSGSLVGRNDDKSVSESNWRRSTGDCRETFVKDACAALTRRVENLEFDKVTQALEITKLKRRVKKLERKNKLITKVVTAAIETVTAASAIITAVEAQVPAATTAITLTAAPVRVVVALSRRRKG
nr:hypothetical protein [Tanacetum cinerariifolium]